MNKCLKMKKKQNFDLFFSSCVFFAKKKSFFPKKTSLFFRVATLSGMKVYRNIRQEKIMLFFSKVPGHYLIKDNLTTQAIEKNNPIIQSGNHLCADTKNFCE